MTHKKILKTTRCLNFAKELPILIGSLSRTCYTWNTLHRHQNLAPPKNYSAFCALFLVQTVEYHMYTVNWQDVGNALPPFLRDSNRNRDKLAKIKHKIKMIKNDCFKQVTSYLCGWSRILVILNLFFIPDDLDFGSDTKDLEFLFLTFRNSSLAPDINLLLLMIIW